MVAARAISFRRDKYPVPLSIDVAHARALRGFIQTDEPHALGFYEVVLTGGGARGALEIDGAGHDLAPGTAFVTRPGQIRRWHLRSSLDAMVLLFEREFVDGFAADPAFLDDFIHDASEAAAVRLDGRDGDRAARLLVELADEITHLRADRDHALRAGLYQLLVALRRGATPAAARPEGAAGLARRFTRLVERHFREHQRVLDYARLLGVTPEHLSRIVRRDAGVRASDVIHGRLLLEAKRRLRYTDAPVAAIADELCFSDASYFVRFFRRATGVTPHRFRTSHSRS